MSLDDLERRIASRREVSEARSVERERYENLLHSGHLSPEENDGLKREYEAKFGGGCTRYREPITNTPQDLRVPSPVSAPP